MAVQRLLVPLALTLMAGCDTTAPPNSDVARSAVVDEPPSFGPRGGTVNYCPNQDSVPGASGSLCVPVPGGRPAPVAWWTRAHTYEYTTCSSAEWDNDLSVGAGTTIVLPHDSEYLGESSSYSYQTCGGAWGYGPTFHDMVSGVNFHFNHLKPEWKTFASVAAGTIIKAGSFVGVSGGDTCETGYCNCAIGSCCTGGTSCPLEGGGSSWCAKTNSTGSHLCVVVNTNNMAAVFGTGGVPSCAVSSDPCSKQFAGGGYYCGATIGGDANALYLCQNYATASKTPCPCGCMVNPPGTNDACAACPPDMATPPPPADMASSTPPGDLGSQAPPGDGGGGSGRDLAASPSGDGGSNGASATEGCSVGGAGRRGALAPVLALLLLGLCVRRRR